MWQDSINRKVVAEGEVDVDSVVAVAEVDVDSAGVAFVVEEVGVEAFVVVAGEAVEVDTIPTTKFNKKR
jgi:hypothetical protein